MQVCGSHVNEQKGLKRLRSYLILKKQKQNKTNKQTNKQKKKRKKSLPLARI